MLQFEKIGPLIRQAREKRRLSLRKFAAEAGVDHTVLLRLENGGDVKLSAFVKIARVAGYDFGLDVG